MGEERFSWLQGETVNDYLIRLGVERLPSKGGSDSVYRAVSLVHLNLEPSPRDLLFLRVVLVRRLLDGVRAGTALLPDKLWVQGEHTNIGSEKDLVDAVLCRGASMDMDHVSYLVPNDVLFCVFVAKETCTLVTSFKGVSQKRIKVALKKFVLLGVFENAAQHGEGGRESELDHVAPCVERGWREEVLQGQSRLRELLVERLGEEHTSSLEEAFVTGGASSFVEAAKVCLFFSSRLIFVRASCPWACVLGCM